MAKKGMNRRQFLQTSGLAAGGVAAVASGAALIAPDGAWALQLSALDEHTAKTLLAMSRRIYPHDGLGDMYYAKVVEDLDKAANADKDVGTLLRGAWPAWTRPSTSSSWTCPRAISSRS